jgi:hypothetical protein
VTLVPVPDVPDDDVEDGSGEGGDGSAGAGEVAGAEDRADAAAEPEEPEEPSVDPATLAIPDYESLSASQVVPRLESLTNDELEAIRQYENGNRARRTILNKIAQLQAS